MQKNLIVGGGISGLSLAYFISKAGKQVKLVESNSRLGGWIESSTKNGFLLERGTRSMNPKLHNIGSVASMVGIISIILTFINIYRYLILV